MKQYLQLSFLFLCIIISGCSKSGTQITSLKQLEGGHIIAVPTGTVADKFVLDRFPDAKVVYYNTVADCALAVREGKAEAAAYDKPVLKNIASKIEGLTVLDELLIDDYYGFAVQLSQAELKTAVDQTLAQLKSEGTYNEMMQRWFPESGAPKPMPTFQFTGENGVLRFGTAAVTEPMAFYNAQQQIVGFDIEFAAYIAQTLGKKLEVIDMEFSALLPALISGKVDMIGAGISITEERAKKVLFSESYYESGIAAIVQFSKKVIDETKISEQKLTPENIGTKKIGVLLGSSHEEYAMNNYPKAKIFPFQTLSDMFMALNSKKVDVAFLEDPSIGEILNDESNFGILKKNVFTAPIGAAFNKKNQQLKEQYNAFLKEIQSNGVYNDIYTRWIDQNLHEQGKIEVKSGNGKLIVGISSDLGFPFIGMKDGKLVGFDVELAQHFAAYLGKELVLSDMPFGSLIAALSSGKIDLIHSSLTITEERKEMVDFSDVNFESGATILALKENIAQTEQAIFTTIDDIGDKRIGINSGTVHDAFLQENYPKAQRFLYDFPSDLILALKMEKLDAIMLDNISAQVMIKHNPELVIFNNDIFNTPLGIGFNKKNPKLKQEFNQFLADIRNDKTFDEMSQRWFVDDPELAVMPKFENPKTGKKLIAGIAIADLPYVAYMNGEYVGFDIEMIQRFAERNQYELKILTLEFSSLIAALQSGKVDLIADGISISKERAELIDFSDAYADFQTAVVIAKKNMAGFVSTAKIKDKSTFFETLANSFHNNIIRENRYLLIITGLKVTLLISILASILGTLIGGLLCFLRMSKNKLATRITSLFVDLVRGTPVLVLLMIIFYVVFASVNINPIIVAVIAFGLNFGAYVSEIFRTSIESIDKGQREAGIASGFSHSQTFFNIIMPQALQRMLPVYKGEFISMVKMTSIVGYIAVQDLTKASDIIRSRTFDAFFPLIMAAVLYIIIAFSFTWLLSRIEISVDPKKRKIKKMKEETL